MKSKTDSQKKAEGLKSLFEKLPQSEKGVTRTIQVVGSSLNVKSHRQGVKEAEPQVAIDVDENIINLEGLITLGKRVRHLATETPLPTFYADAWLKMSLNYSEIPPLQKPSVEDVAIFFEKLPKDLREFLQRRKNINFLEMRLFQAFSLFEPLIFIESDFKLNKNGNSYVPRDYVDDKGIFFKTLERDISLYKVTLEKINLLNHLIIYVESLPLPLKDIYSAKTEISRANYAFMVMVFAALHDEIQKHALFKCKACVESTQKGKLTKIAVHTLCRIIYELLESHAPDKGPSGKAFLRNYTSRLLNAFSPINNKGEPYYQIESRGVEYALTGK